MRPEPRWWPFQAEDVWVFALPAAKQQGTFTSLTIEFATEGGPRHGHHHDHARR